MTKGKEVTSGSGIRYATEAPETITAQQDMGRRLVVYTMPRRTVLVKILAMGPIKGLEKKDRNEAMIDLVHHTEAQERGLNFTRYREKGDTGHCKFQKEAGVRTTNLLNQLKSLGLHYTGGHWQQNEGKGPVNTLTFSSEGTPVNLPPSIREILGRRFNNATIWCNVKTDDEKGVQFRLDTINLAKGRITSESSRELLIDGNTYRLV